MGVAVIGGMAAMIFTANCSSGGERTGGGGSTGQSTGNAGSPGTGGSGGAAEPPYTCSNEQKLDCTMPITLSDGHVTDFNPREWNGNAGKYCNAAGLRGSIYSYAGNDKTVSQTSKIDAGALLLTLNVLSTDYAGGGMSFDHCVTVPDTFNALQFTASIASGDITGCDWGVQIKTYEQFPTNGTPAPGGCDPNTTSCYGFPAVKNAVALTTTPQTVTIKIADFMPPAVSPPTAQQIVGLQWQVESGAPLDPDGGAQAACMVGLRIDDIQFVTK